MPESDRRVVAFFVFLIVVSFFIMLMTGFVFASWRF